MSCQSSSTSKIPDTYALDNLGRAKQYMQNNQLQCIMFSEFDRILGYRKVIQYPEHPVVFTDPYRDILLPKNFLHSKTVTIKTHNKEKIVSYAVSLNNDNYHRRMYMFNLSLVLDSDLKSSPFVSITKKIAEFFKQIEEATHFFSERVSESENKNPNYCEMENREELRDYLVKIYQDINSSGSTQTTFPNEHIVSKLKQKNYSNRINLDTSIGMNSEINDQRTMNDAPCRSETFLLSAHVSAFKKKPKIPSIYQVPFVWLHNKKNGELSIHNQNYDICTQKFLENLKRYPFSHIAEIAHETKMQRRLVCDIVADLIHYEMCTVTSIFQYSNRYRVSGNFRILYENRNLQQLLLEYSKRKLKIEKPDELIGNKDGHNNHGSSYQPNFSSNIFSNPTFQNQTLPYQTFQQQTFQKSNNHTFLNETCTTNGRPESVSNFDSFPDYTPTVTDLFKILREFNNDVSVKRVLKLSHLHKSLSKIDIKKLVHAASAYGILTRLYDFPVTDNNKLTCTIGSEDTEDALFDGSVHFDEILVSLASVDDEIVHLKTPVEQVETEKSRQSYRSLKKQILMDAPDTVSCMK